MRTFAQALWALLGLVSGGLLLALLIAEGAEAWPPIVLLAAVLAMAVADLRALAGGPAHLARGAAVGAVATAGAFVLAVLGAFFGLAEALCESDCRPTATDDLLLGGALVLFAAALAAVARTVLDRGRGDR